ncbi:hypothetical protein AN189_10590 [Loktanella sp. 3ANDIMAR09]|uniref:hypothetical protein n=1 Tax=Loktanella sp. 3ANDIMAR09 TaxID=1225657 RepID=UPI0006FEF370|nr:hypothetical protein [Loktanella sp. 3ANDIMAR09]KQI68266.1 hypothetical protein AN189_10590 [Loktanella sp. 3ANDIMAR09]
MTQVTVLECLLDCAIDHGLLHDLYARQGAARADRTIATALEDLARRLGIMRDGRDHGGFDDLPGQARRMATIAAQIGLTEVATAAGHVANSARQRDGIAVEATMARLERSFDLAIGQVWMLRGG